MANKKARERELAAQLFMNTNMSQKEIAENVGVSEKTISGWALEGKWENLKTAKQTTYAESLADMQFLLNRMLQKKKDKMEADTYTKEDSDSILELTKSINLLEGKIPLRTKIQVLEEFMDFIPQKNSKLKTALAAFQTQYLLSSNLKG